MTNYAGITYVLNTLLLSDMGWDESRMENVALESFRIIKIGRTRLDNILLLLSVRCTILVTIECSQRPARDRLQQQISRKDDKRERNNWSMITDLSVIQPAPVLLMVLLVGNGIMLRIKS